MKRFKAELKRTTIPWLHEIPSYWSVAPIKYLATEKNSYFNDGDWIESKDIQSNGISYLTTGNIGPGFFKTKDSNYISEDTFNSLNCSEVFPGDILISRLNSPVGRACIVPELEHQLVTSVDNVIFRPDTKLNPAFFVFLSSSKEYFKHTGDLSRGTTMQRISRSILGSIRIPLPPAGEQQKIAQFLDYETAKIDALIDEQKRLIELLKEKRQAVISNAVTKGLNPDAPMKDSGVEWLGEVPEHWIVVQLKRVSTINDEALSENTPADTLITYVEIGDIDNTQKISNLTEYEFQKAPSRARRKVRNGDVIISTVRTYLKAIAAINAPPQNMVVSTGFAVLRPIEQLITPEFLGYSIRADGFISEIIARSVGVSYPAINASDVHGLKIAVPGLKEQKEIGEWISSELNKLEILSDEVLRLISHLKERRSALISAAVTGKIDVRNWQPPAGSDTVDSNASVQTERHYG